MYFPNNLNIKTLTCRRLCRIDSKQSWTRFSYFIWNPAFTRLDLHAGTFLMEGYRFIKYKTTVLQFKVRILLLCFDGGRYRKSNI